MGTKRKQPVDGFAEIEVNLQADEPPSRKALRKAKAKKASENLHDSKNPKGPSSESTLRSREPESGARALSESNENATPTSNGAETSQSISETKKKPSKVTLRSQYAIWIGNLPFAATRPDICTFLTSNSSLTEANITRVHIRPPSTAKLGGRARNQGFAYVDLDSKAAQAQALALSELPFTLQRASEPGGDPRPGFSRTVLIKDATSFAGRPSQKTAADSSNSPTKAGNGHSPSRRIFVGNLGFDVTQHELQTHFERCGPVQEVMMTTFEDTGKCKGFGWVQFEDQEAATLAARGWFEDVEAVDAHSTNEDGDDLEASEPLHSTPDQDPDSKNLSRDPSAKATPAKRVWVNRMHGRKLRIEYAEDATTRYQKRFGKEKEGKADEVRRDNPRHEARHGRDVKRSSTRSSAVVEHAAEEQDVTVARLTGAMMKGQGTKVVFDD